MSAVAATSKGATRLLAEFAAKLRYDDVPADVIEMAKIHTLNILACALRGHSLESAQMVVKVHRMMGGVAEAVVVGEGMRLPAAMAAGVNAHSAYCTMHDDTFFEGTIHPGHTAIAASLAVGEREGSSGKEFLTGVVAGLEVGCRVAASLCQSPEAHKARLGWHCNISDAFVGIGSAGKLLGLTADQFVAGLGIAATSSSGLVETMNPPPSYVWPWDGGMNTYLAVLGAYLAREGMTAGETALEGEQGYIRMFTEGKARPDAYERVVRGLGREWHTSEISIKTRCASYMMHAAINAAQRAVQKNGVTPENIESILVKTNHWTSGRLMQERISDYNSTVFSLPFAIAVAILEGTEMTVPDQHVSRLNDPETRNLMGKVRASLDPDIDKVFGARMPALVILTSKDGREFREFEDMPKGKYPERPLSDSELLMKVRANARHTLAASKVETLIQAVKNLDQCDNVTALGDLVTG